MSKKSEPWYFRRNLCDILNSCYLISIYETPGGKQGTDFESFYFKEQDKGSLKKVKGSLVGAFSKGSLKIDRKFSHIENAKKLGEEIPNLEREIREIDSLKVEIEKRIQVDAGGRLPMTAGSKEPHYVICARDLRQAGEKKREYEASLELMKTSMSEAVFNIGYGITKELFEAGVEHEFFINFQTVEKLLFDMLLYENDVTFAPYELEDLVKSFISTFPARNNDFFKLLPVTEENFGSATDDEKTCYVKSCTMTQINILLAGYGDYAKQFENDLEAKASIFILKSLLIGLLPNKMSWNADFNTQMNVPPKKDASETLEGRNFNYIVQTIPLLKTLEDVVKHSMRFLFTNGVSYPVDEGISIDWSARTSAYVPRGMANNIAFFAKNGKQKGSDPTSCSDYLNGYHRKFLNACDLAVGEKLDIPKNLALVGLREYTKGNGNERELLLVNDEIKEEFGLVEEAPRAFESVGLKQGALLGQFSKFYRAFIDFSRAEEGKSKLDEIFRMFEKGMCFGLSTLWGIDKMKSNGANFIKGLTAVSNWDGSRSGLEVVAYDTSTVEEVIKKFLSQIFIFQCPTAALKYELQTQYPQEEFPEFLEQVGYFQDAGQINACYSNIITPCYCNAIPKMTRIFAFSFLFDVKSLFQFIITFPVGKIIVLSANSHAIGIFVREEGVFDLYDPNFGPLGDYDGITAAAYSKSLLPKIAKSLLFDRKGEKNHFEIAANIYDFEGADNKELVARLRALNNFNNYVRHLGDDRKLLNRCFIFMASENNFNFLSDVEAFVRKIGYKIDFNFSDTKGNDVLMYAVIYSNVDAVRWLVGRFPMLLKNTSPNSTFAIGEALKRGNPGIIVPLLGSATREVWEMKGPGSDKTRLIESLVCSHRKKGGAAFLRYIDVRNVLWEKHKDKTGGTLLIYAIIMQNVAMLEIVLGWLFASNTCYILLLMEKSIDGQNAFDYARESRQSAEPKDKAVMKEIWGLLVEALKLAERFGGNKIGGVSDRYVDDVLFEDDIGRANISDFLSL